MGVGGSQNLSLIEVKSQVVNYKISISSDELIYDPKYFYVIDKNLKTFIPKSLNRTLFVEVNESHKTLVEVEGIASSLSDLGMTKNGQLCVIGGGFLQDLGTCVSSLYMRGVSWIFMPTTLAAMGDSCMGGKSSINAGMVKNLLGNFYPPKSIYIDISWVKSLPQLEIVAGLSEILKICFARSQEAFLECLTLLDSWRTTNDYSQLMRLIELSLQSKKYFVEIDEFDVGPRKLLNFGHTFGHAIESASNFKIPHGVAVLVGMLAACEHESGVQSEAIDSLKAICLNILSLVEKDINTYLNALKSEDIAAFMKKDKKNDANNLVLILPNDKGLFIHKEPLDIGIQRAGKALKIALGKITNEFC